MPVGVPGDSYSVKSGTQQEFNRFQFKQWIVQYYEKSWVFNSTPGCCKMTSLYKVNNNITDKKNVSQSARKHFPYASLTARPLLSLSNDLVPSLLLSRTNILSLKLRLTLFSSHFPSRLTLGKCCVFTISLVIKSHCPKCVPHYCSLIRITSTALCLKQQLWRFKALQVCFSWQSIPNAYDYYYYYCYYFKFPSSKDFSLITYSSRD